MRSCQLDLFAAAPQKSDPDPRPVSGVWTKDGQVHVHLVDGQLYSEVLRTGPLTRGECAGWTVPCALYRCRYRLDDEVEARTSRAEVEPCMDDFEGPRTVAGAYYSETPIGPGHWCALTVADVGGRGDGREIDENVSLQELGDMFGFTRERARAVVEDALEALNMADIDQGGLSMLSENGRTLRQLYGDRGVVRTRSKTEDDDMPTDAEVRQWKVPGAPLPRQMKVTRVVRRRPRKDPWEGVVRRIPAEFSERVDEKLMNPLRPNDRIEERFMKPLSPPGRRS